MVLKSITNQKLQVITILFIVFIVLRNHLTPGKVRNGAFRHQINFAAHVQGIPNFKEYQNCIIGSKVTAFFLNVWILPISGVAS